LTKAYYRGAAGIVCVFDVTDRVSFNNVTYWLKKIKKHGDENVNIILMGNKIDLINEIVVEREEAESLADFYGCEYFETCAKNSTNVDEAFKFLLSSIANNENLQEKIKVD
jgi:small GTP-binding protein